MVAGISLFLVGCILCVRNANKPNKQVMEPTQQE